MSREDEVIILISASAASNVEGAQIGQTYDEASRIVWMLEEAGSIRDLCC